MKRGFTLIEVLVVVAIIALLISILLPSLAVARDQARSAKCLANMRDMATGVITFTSTHKNRFQLVTGMNANPDPYALGGPVADPNRSNYIYESGPLPVGAQGPALLAWPVILLRESGRRELRRNADWGVEGNTRSDALSAGKIRSFGLMECPADDIKVATPVYPLTKAGKRWFGTLSYAINEDIVGDDRVDSTNGACFKDGHKGGTPGGGSRMQGLIDKVIRPSEVLMFTDGGSDRSTAVSDDPWTLVLSKDAAGPTLEYCEKQWNNRLPVMRHRRGSLNVTYVDGHGGFVSRQAKTPTDNRLPDHVYSPKVRVSPYNAGVFPVLN